jgi:hypothetical protein
MIAEGYYLMRDGKFIPEVEYVKEERISEARERAIYDFRHQCIKMGYSPVADLWGGPFGKPVQTFILGKDSIIIILDIYKELNSISTSGRLGRGVFTDVLLIGNQPEDILRAKSELEEKTGFSLG